MDSLPATPNWRIRYDDGSSFDSTMGEPEDAPGYGVITIVQFKPDGSRVISHRNDWYYWIESENMWRGGDMDGLHDRLCHRLPTRAVCSGREVSDWLYAEIMGKTDKDPDFPPKGRGK